MSAGNTSGLLSSVGSAWEFLLRCLRGEADGHSEMPQPGSWPALFQLAEDHGVIPQLSATLLADRSRARLPADVEQDLRERQRAKAFSSLMLNAELFRVTGLLQSAGVEFALVKGPALGVRAYGHAGAREYGDLDIVVRHRDIPRVHQRMTAGGFWPEISSEAIRAKKIPGQYLFVKSPAQLIVEFHTERTMRYFPRGLPLEDFLARRESVTIDDREIATFALSDELILICVHGSKHLWERLSFVADVAGLIALNKNLDWDLALATSQKAGAGTMLRSGLLLARDLLRAPIPPEVSAKLSADRPLLQLAAQVQRWLPFAGAESAGVFQRMRYRVNMSGGGLSGIAHLCRLALAPTQEDWETWKGSRSPADSASRSTSLPALRRVVRLAKQYRRTKSSG